MIKNFLFAVALLSLALAGGCAKGGNGEGSGISVDVAITSPTTNFNPSYVYPTQTLTLTATVTGTSNKDVTWSLSGTGCTGSACGTFTSTAPPSGTTPATAIYVAPATPPTANSKPAPVTITATSSADSTAAGTQPITVQPVTVVVTPTTVTVGQNLVQQFTAVEVPDDAPQSFTWTCTPTGSCGSLYCGTNNPSCDTPTSDPAVYTAPSSNGSVVAVATSTVQQPTAGAGQAKVTVATSRLTASPYTLRFSGYDNVNHPVAIAGSLTFDKNGVFQQGVEDELVNIGAGSVPHHYTVNSATFTPVANNNNANNTNNAGTLTVDATVGGGQLNRYSVVLDSTGNLRMIESDGNWTGSGSMEQATPTKFANAASLSGAFVFGFTGTDLNGKRVGYVGVLPMDGTGNIGKAPTPGLLDLNKGGTAKSSTNVTGTYTMNNGVGTMTVTASDLPGAPTYDFNLYGISGQAKATNPLTLYAISTDTIDANHAALSGRMVFQDPKTTYDKTALSADSVSHLTGVDSTGSNTLVALVSATGDGNGNISASFDANNAGTIVAAQSFNCTYTTETGGRYVVTLLGNGSTCTAPALPFVFYASGANRGFLLDQSSAAVMTGAMDPQAGNGTFAPSELPSTYAVGTVSNATSGVVPMAANLLLTSPGNQTYNVAGTQYPGAQAVTGTYTLTFAGTGTIVLTAPAANYVIYAMDKSHFEMIDVDKTVTNASVIYAQQ